jgi:subtilisin
MVWVESNTMRVRIGVIDSGVDPAHPGIGPIAAGAAITSEGFSKIYLDYLGHGTAVAAAIRARAPEAELYIAKVFDRALTTDIDRLIRAIDWCIAQPVDLINLSLGTPNPAHEAALCAAIERASRSNAVIVAPGDGSLPGRLAGVLAVKEPHPQGFSFAVAELTGRLARQMQLRAAGRRADFGRRNRTGYLPRTAL